MPRLPDWTMSHHARARLEEVINEAESYGLDPDLVAAGGLAGIRALLALKQATANSGPTRDHHIARVQDAFASLAPERHGPLIQQLQARILALQGRGADTEVAHVAPGEIVIPRALQTPEVMDAIGWAAAQRGIPLDQLRIGEPENRVNPKTGVAEFAGEPGAGISVPMPEVTVSARRPKFDLDADAKLLGRMMFSEAAQDWDKDGVYEHIGWTAANRIGAPTFPETLQDVILKRNAYQSTQDDLWRQAEDPSKLSPLNAKAYSRAQEVARGILDGTVQDPTGGAQFFFHGTPNKEFSDLMLSGRLVPIERKFDNLTVLRDTARPPPMR